MTLEVRSDPKRRILDYLKRSAASSTQSIAARLSVSEVAARQHLFDLEARGLITKETAAPSGRGRPGMAWKLTPLAYDLFPDRHDALTVDLIDSIRGALGPEALDRVIEARAARQLADLTRAMSPDASLRERLDIVAAQRSSEGYMAEVATDDNGDLLLVEHHCPICDAASTCQLFCVSEIDLFQAALGPDVDVTREEHLLSGDERCVYRITQRR